MPTSSPLASRTTSQRPATSRTPGPWRCYVWRSASAPLAEQHVIDAIRAARTSGMSWSAIGAFVGTSGEAARQRYADKVA